jgi:L-ribulokinase
MVDIPVIERKHMRKQILVGIDFGTDSVRTLFCDAQSGITISCGVSEYPRWKSKLYCKSGNNQYRQHALDYVEGLTNSFCKALGEAYPEAGNDIIGIAVDTTGSTPCPVDKNGTPLCLLSEFEENPNAMFHLWKDHTAVEEAKEINTIFRSGKIDYTKYQGVYSSEWFWAKILHTVRNAPEIREHAYSWIEHSDWVVGLLAGSTSADKFFRGSCSSGHKALWNSEFGGLPSRDVLISLDPYLGLIYDSYPMRTIPAGTCIGSISPYWANKLHINAEAKIGMGSFDAHAGGVGAGIEKKTMVKVVGTSTVDLVIEDSEVLLGKDLREVCGQAEDSIVPGFMGLEMGQPSFGDSYLWVRDLSLWSLKEINFPSEILTEKNRKILQSFLEKNIIKDLEAKAEKHIYDTEIAVDWFNGRRYPSLNEDVKSVFAHVSLGTDLPALFCAVVKGTIFGSRRIFESLINNGIVIEKVIAVGGIAEKSSFVMQMLADVMKIPIYICRDKQVCAKGSVIYAGVAAGLFTSIPEAQGKYCQFDDTPYLPDETRSAFYDRQYLEYLEMGELGESLSGKF